MTGATTEGQGMAAADPETPKVCVIVSYWTGHPRRNIRRLLRSLSARRPGHAYDLLVVCNGGDVAPLAATELGLATDAASRIRIVNRANAGYNLGAWEAGWRAAPGYDHYLFLQDECLATRDDWLGAFVYRMRFDPGLGLLGESMMWDRLGWSFIEEDSRRTASRRGTGSSGLTVEGIRDALAGMGIAEGREGSHLQSLVWYATAEALEAVGGIPSAEDYRGAVACEVGVSRAMEAAGFRIAQVSREPFRYLTHSQWTVLGRARMRASRLKGRVGAWARRMGLRK